MALSHCMPVSWILSRRLLQVLFFVMLLEICLVQIQIQIHNTFQSKHNECKGDNIQFWPIVVPTTHIECDPCLCYISSDIYNMFLLVSGLWSSCLGLYLVIFYTDSQVQQYSTNKKGRVTRTWLRLFGFFHQLQCLSSEKIKDQDHIVCGTDRRTGIAYITMFECVD